MAEVSWLRVHTLANSTATMMGGFSRSYAESEDLYSSLINQMYGSPGDSPASITTDFSVDANEDPYASGSFTDERTGTTLNLAPTVYAESLSAPSAIPEPTSLLLFGLGMMGMFIVAGRRQRLQVIYFVTLF